MAMTKMYCFIILSLSLVTGCSILKPQSATPGSKTESKSRPGTSGDTQDSASKKARSSKAVWHLIEPLGLEITVTSHDKKIRETHFIDKTLSEIEMDTGDWQISGFILDGKKYELLDTSKNFGFKLKPKISTYAGSIIVQCPTVSKKYVGELKKMNFFNRLSFKHGNNLCEMVIGDQYRAVRKVWNKLSPDKKKSRLVMGF